VFVARNLRHFQVHSSPGRVPTFIRNVIISGIALAGLYVGGGWVLHAQFTHSVSFGDLVADLPERFIPVSFLRHELISFLPSSPVTGLLYNWIGPLFWLIIIAGALWAYSDVGARNYTEELPRVRALLQRGGGGFFSQWATWKGNSYWFSADGRASVAYRVIAGVAITTSEPIGDREAARDAISGFARFCDDRGWIPVFYAIHQEYLPAIRRMGWRSITIGEEAVIRPTTWTTTGKRWQDIRTSINRAERAGVRAVWTDYSQLSAKRAEQISRISSEWTNGKALPEMGFTLGSLEELRLPGVALMLACDAEDNILGVTSWLPSYRDGQIIGWTLDFMRRSPDGMNGVMEFLIAKCAERFRDEGAEFMSLSTAPLASTIRPQELSDQLLMRLGSLIEPYYGFRSLFRFKQKFQPELMPISMAYPDALGLPAIGLALARAYLPAITLRQTSNFLRHRKISQPRNLPQPSRDKVLV
jgi:phosphatidylglycerol lysyltransferase